MSHLHLSGFSETRAMVEFGALPALSCNKSHCVNCDFLNDERCREDPRWRMERNTSFLAYCREERQLAAIYEVPCSPLAGAWPLSKRNGSRVTLSYAWKSFVDSPLDDKVEAFLEEHAHHLRELCDARQ